MRLVRVKLHNFRSYGCEVEIAIDDLTVILGQNDAGKSSILDALEIFFNEPKGQPEPDDFNVRGPADTASITCVFTDVTEEMVIDEATPTTLADEYMLNIDGRLEIKKVFNKSSGKAKILAVANHPQNNACNELLTLTNAKLKDVAKKQGIDLAGVDQRINTQLRRAIWAACDDLQLGEVEIELAKEAAKTVWEKLKPKMPVYALFKSDRPSTDQDAEAQDPMKIAIKEAIQTQKDELAAIQQRVETQVQQIANRTVDKIMEMSPELARELKPRIKTKNWDSLFHVSLTGDEDIPINKRGSGTRRLILLNFFRAKAEQDSSCKGTGVIYAVEEPETSQHPNNQRMLIEAFEDLVSDGTCQVLLTTHTPVLARRFSRERLRIVARDNGSVTAKEGINDQAMRTIVNTLGILPDHDVKMFLVVEGKHDMNFLRVISKTLSAAGEEMPDLKEAEEEGRLVFIPCGGSSVELWVARLKHFNIAEFHIFDRDNPPEMLSHYKTTADEINGRDHAEAVHTSKRELENYIHPDVIAANVPGYTGPDSIGVDHDHIDIPQLIATARGTNGKKAKRWINTELVAAMTPDHLTAVDPDGELRGWLRAIAVRLNA